MQRVNISGFISTPKPVDPTNGLGGNNIRFVFTGRSIDDELPDFIPNELGDWRVDRGTGPNGADQLYIQLLPYSATAIELLPDGPQLSKF